MTLVGVPGIGKSRLVHELSLIVERDEELIVWRRGRSLPYGEGVAYWALGEIVKAQAGILESDGADDASRKLARAVSDLVADAAEAAWIERQLRALVGSRRRTTHSRRARKAFAARRRFLEALAEDGPAVLVFEDLHWADDDLLDFVDELAERLDAVPLLLICTARPELLSRRPGWGGGKLNAVTLSLEPLSDGDTARLLQTLLERSVLPAEQAGGHHRAGGRRAAVRRGVRPHAGGGKRHRTTSRRRCRASSPLGSTGCRRRRRPSFRTRRFSARCSGRTPSADLTGLDGHDLDERLRALERREFVRRERRSAVEGARQYVFLHALVRDVAYGQIPRAGRAEKHRAAADWISALPGDRAEDRAEMLTHHLESAIAYGESAGIDVGDLRPRAVAALKEAGDRAWQLNIAARAAQLYRRALDVCYRRRARSGASVPLRTRTGVRGGVGWRPDRRPQGVDRRPGSRRQAGAGGDRRGDTQPSPVEHAKPRSRARLQGARAGRRQRPHIDPVRGAVDCRGSLGDQRPTGGRTSTLRGGADHRPGER